MLLLAFLEVSPAVDHSCPGSQGVQSAVKSGSLARTVSPTSRAGEELRKPGRPPGGLLRWEVMALWARPGLSLCGPEAEEPALPFTKCHGIWIQTPNLGGL